MVNLSVCVDKIPDKNRYLVAKDTVYASVTFADDEQTRNFVEKVCARFDAQNKAVIIEDGSIGGYAGYFHGARLIEDGFCTIALDADSDEVANVISNWCFYEISAAVYFMADHADYAAWSDTKARRCSKRELESFLKSNADVSIHQVLDYTVNICSSKKAFGAVWDILKTEEFALS